MGPAPNEGGAEPRVRSAPSLAALRPLILLVDTQDLEPPRGELSQGGAEVYGLGSDPGIEGGSEDDLELRVVRGVAQERTEESNPRGVALGFAGSLPATPLVVGVGVLHRHHPLSLTPRLRPGHAAELRQPTNCAPNRP